MRWAALAMIKHQISACTVVFLTDLKTSSKYPRMFKEAASCDRDMRKPIHGSRLRGISSPPRFRSICK
jgi:hypothetical protein